MPTRTARTSTSAQTETKHTKGPWLVRERSNGFSVVDLSGVIATVSSARTRQEANARLIAASPDLLEALRAMHAAFNAKRPIPKEEGDALEAMCRAALSKAGA
jgi:hypothetical protein